MPWRNVRDPYRIVVSEIMLQQTQVSRVMQKYGEFIKEFPNFKSLAKASQTHVLRAWQGLGYNRRAVALKRLSEIIVKEYKGKLPHDTASLQNLPGIGASTAGSIAAFAFNVPSAFIETNIRRVYIHFFFPRAKKVSDEDILRLVKKTVPKKNVHGAWLQGVTSREWYYALMDYGAMLAKQVENPNKKSARYRIQPKFKGSNRELRGKIIKLLLQKKSIDFRTLRNHLKEPIRRVKTILALLCKEELIQEHTGRYSIS